VRKKEENGRLDRPSAICPERNRKVFIGIGTPGRPNNFLRAISQDGRKKKTTSHPGKGGPHPGQKITYTGAGPIFQGRIQSFGQETGWRKKTIP